MPQMVNVNVKLLVEDAYKDQYEQDFTVQIDEDEGEILLCDLCGNRIFGNTCASGHVAYTIVDRDMLSKISEVITG